jgi:hypothetical protein
VRLRLGRRHTLWKPLWLETFGSECFDDEEIPPDLVDEAGHLMPFGRSGRHNGAHFEAAP